MLSVRPAPSPIIPTLAPPATQALPWRDVLHRLRPVATRPQDALTPRIELRSDEALPRDVQQRALSTAAAAYDNARRSLGYPVTAAPLTLGLTSDALTAGRSGFSTPSAKEVMTGAFHFRRPSLDSFAAFGLGRELGHAEMKRAGAPIGRVPGYFGEGVATCLGSLFVLRPGGADTNAVAAIARQLNTFTATDAVRMFHAVSSPADDGKQSVRQAGISERLGSLFIEHLKARVVGPHHYYPRVGAMLQRIGQGMDFGTSFHKAMGVTLADAQKSFVAFMAATSMGTASMGTAQGNPAARLKGTVYQNHA
jgi:hypothetical protein